jgi:hypothetical protein
MTENSFLDAMPAADEPSGDSNRRALVLGGSVLAVAALGFGGYTLLGGSSRTPTPTPALGLHSFGTTPVTTHAVAKTPAKVQVVPVVSKQRIGKDPFLALYVVPAAAAPSTTSPTTTVPTSTSTNTTPTTTTTTPTVVKPVNHTLKLTRVYGSGKDQTAVFAIDGRTQLAKVGSVFGPTAELKLLNVGQDAKGHWVATLQVGDGQPFDALMGQTLYVR